MWSNTTDRGGGRRTLESMGEFEKRDSQVVPKELRSFKPSQFSNMSFVLQDYSAHLYETQELQASLGSQDRILQFSISCYLNYRHLEKEYIGNFTNNRESWLELIIKNGLILLQPNIPQQSPNKETPDLIVWIEAWVSKIPKGL